MFRTAHTRAASHLSKALKHLHRASELTASDPHPHSMISELLTLDTLQHLPGNRSLTTDATHATAVVLAAAPSPVLGDPAGGMYERHEDEVLAIAEAVGVVHDRRQRAATGRAVVVPLRPRGQEG